jgi:hypothetical protein
VKASKGLKEHPLSVALYIIAHFILLKHVQVLWDCVWQWVLRPPAEN